MVLFGHFRVIPSCVLCGSVVALPGLFHSLGLFGQLAALCSICLWGLVSWHVYRLQQVVLSNDPHVWQVSVDGQARILLRSGCLAQFGVNAWTNPSLYRQQLGNLLWVLLKILTELAVYLPVTLFWCLLAGICLARSNPFDLFDGAYQLIIDRDPAALFGALGSAALIISLIQLSRLLNDPTVYGFKNCFWLQQQRSICHFIDPQIEGSIDLSPIPYSHLDAGELAKRILS